MVITDSQLLIFAIGCTCWMLGLVSACTDQVNNIPNFIQETAKFLNGAALLFGIVAWGFWIF